MCVHFIRLLTGFSEGYKEAFTSGDMEPWTFRGGLQSELQVCMGYNCLLNDRPAEEIAGPHPMQLTVRWEVGWTVKPHPSLTFFPFSQALFMLLHQSRLFSWQDFRYSRTAEARVGDSQHVWDREKTVMQQFLWCTVWSHTSLLLGRYRNLKTYMYLSFQMLFGHRGVNFSGIVAWLFSLTHVGWRRFELVWSCTWISPLLSSIWRWIQA